jgi:thiamine-phosphate pyrophosphorylase
MSAEPTPEDRFEPDFGREDRPPCQLYLVSPPSFELARHAEALKAALGAGGPIAAYQLRMKPAAPGPLGPRGGANDDEVLRAAEILLPICQAADVAFILNDRMDLAKACGADGVHLGQSDGDPRAARNLLGRDAQIGVTCHASRHLAMEAGEAGANYVAFGAFFPTDTKAVEHRAEPDILNWWTAISPIACVAIGGITATNAAPLVAAGADFLATSSAVWQAADGPAAGVRSFESALRSSQR